ncbi:MAG: transketolase family protein [Candidatus Melainabacteria bacterium]|nr:transketolase family protein [Candidatus Melainabacteria bacterium]
MLVANLDKTEKKALRNQFGETLVALGEENQNIVVLDADLACSTQTALFAKRFPERFFNQGIAEQDLMNTAAGLATTGKIPFLSTFAIFATGKAWEPLRNTVCYSHLNVKICPTHSGLSLGEDGASHQSIEDIALTRVIPNLVVLVPADAVETEAAVRWAADYVGPVYIRLVRPNCPVIHDTTRYRLEPYQMQVLRPGTDITLVGTGETVYHALIAAERLATQGIEAEVINCPFIKPLDPHALIESARKTGRVLTVESHNVIGGLGGAVCEALSEQLPTPVKRLGVQDRFGQSGTAEALFAEYGIDSAAIEAAVLAWLPQH